MYVYVYGSESSKLTAREKRDIEYKRKVLTLAKEHRSASEMEKVDRYYMPRDDVVSSNCQFSPFITLFCSCFVILV